MIVLFGCFVGRGCRPLKNRCAVRQEQDREYEKAFEHVLTRVVSTYKVEKPVEKYEEQGTTPPAGWDRSTAGDQRAANDNDGNGVEQIVIAKFDIGGREGSAQSSGQCRQHGADQIDWHV